MATPHPHQIGPSRHPHTSAQYHKVGIGSAQDLPTSCCDEHSSAQQISASIPTTRPQLMLWETIMWSKRRLSGTMAYTIHPYYTPTHDLGTLTRGQHVDSTQSLPIPQQQSVLCFYSGRAEDLE